MRRPPTDPVLAEALATVAEKDRTARTLVTRIGKGLDDRLAAGLAERRILERRDGKRLGLLPRTTWPAPTPPATTSCVAPSPSASSTAGGPTSAPPR